MRSRESWRTSLPATASRRAEPFHAARSRLRRSPRSLRRRDEHVLERGADLLDAGAADCRPRAPRASSASGSRVPRRHQHAQAVAELRDAAHRRRRPRARAAPRRNRRRRSRCTAASMSRASSLRLAFRRNAAAVEDREPVAALGLVHVVRGHEDRRAARRPARTGSPRSRAGSAGRRRSSARRAGAAPARAASPRRARAAGAARPRACRRAASRCASRS